MPDENQFPNADTPQDDHNDDIPFNLATCPTKSDDPQADVDTDVPFKLPHVPDEDYAGPDEDTDEMPAVTAPNQGILDDKPKKGGHNLPTMPIPREPGMPDPKKTVAGGGDGPRANETMRHRAVPADMGRTQQSTPQRADHQRYQQRPSTPPPPSAPRRTACLRRPKSNVLAQNHRAKKGKQGKGKGKSNSGGIGCLNNGCLLIFGGIIASFCGGLTIISLVLLGVAQARLTPIIEEGVRSLTSTTASRVRSIMTATAICCTRTLTRGGACTWRWRTCRSR